MRLGLLGMSRQYLVFIPNDRVLQMASERKFAEFLDGKLQTYAEIAGVPAASLPEDSRWAIEREARDEFTRKGILRDLATALTTYQDSLVGKAPDGLCDGNVLRTVLEENLPTNWPRSTPRVYVTALMNDEGRPQAFCLNEGTSEDRILRLLASTAIPAVFPPVKIDGKVYIDGGCEARGGDNTPLKPILDHHSDIKTVIVVYLNDEKNLGTFRRAKNRAAASAAGVRLVEIVPSANINAQNRPSPARTRAQGCAQGVGGGGDGEDSGKIEAADVGAEVSDLAGGIV